MNLQILSYSLNDCAWILFNQNDWFHAYELSSTLSACFCAFMLRVLLTHDTEFGKLSNSKENQEVLGREQILLELLLLVTHLSSCI